jgi:hypothetical protein
MMSGEVLAAGAPDIFPGRLRRRCITATMLQLMQRRCVAGMADVLGAGSHEEDSLATERYRIR